MLADKPFTAAKLAGENWLFYGTYRMQLTKRSDPLQPFFAVSLSSIDRKRDGPPRPAKYKLDSDFPRQDQTRLISRGVLF
jgi:hypothetical protein